MHIARSSLLHWDPVLVDDVGLVDIEDLDVVRESLGSHLEVATAEWTCPRDLKQLNVVADLCKVDLFVHYKGLLEELGGLLLKTINYKVF